MYFDVFKSSPSVYVECSSVLFCSFLGKKDCLSEIKPSPSLCVNIAILINCLNYSNVMNVEEIIAEGACSTEDLNDMKFYVFEQQLITGRVHSILFYLSYSILLYFIYFYSILFCYVLFFSFIFY